MLEALGIQNFKAWPDMGTLRMAALTVFFGATSAGNRSMGHLLLAFTQTVLSADRGRALHLGDSKSLVDAGICGECLHGCDRTKMDDMTESTSRGRCGQKAP
jgi:hypothetical protein